MHSGQTKQLVKLIKGAVSLVVWLHDVWYGPYIG